MNAEPQRTTRRDKIFLNEQWKEIEENNRIVKTRDLKKIGAIKGTFHTRMGMIWDRNNKELTEAEEIKKRWQEHTEGLNGLNTKKVLMTRIITMV